MNGKAFFDTDVLVYAALKNDPRSESAERLLASGGVISVQVLNELVSVARRKFQMSWAEIRAVLRWVRFLCPNAVSINLGTHEKAVEIAHRFGYVIYDSLIVASSLEAKCSVLYSEDLQHGQVIEELLTIQNPFR
jgi:predicted nucleic acid-binding protein